MRVDPSDSKPEDARAEAVQQFVPSISTREIFEQLIADELRAGRLTSARRGRIIRYAAQLGMSPVEAGRLIDTCREQALESSDATERYHALRLVESDCPRVPTALKLSIVVTLAILVDLLVIRWLW